MESENAKPNFYKEVFYPHKMYIVLEFMLPHWLNIFFCLMVRNLRKAMLPRIMQQSSVTTSLQLCSSKLFA